jgi:two-component system response regulator AdeR
MVNVLVVEDDAADASLIESALVRHPDVCAAHMASDPDEALKLLADGTLRPDLILLDINMPKTNGFAFADELRRHPATADTPVAFLTSSRHRRDIETARQLDVCSYVVKPESFADLQTRLDVVIKRVKSGPWSSK